jgi:hypothetical protein
LSDGWCPKKALPTRYASSKKNKAKLVIVGHVTSHLPWSEQYFLQEVKPHVDGKNIRYIERLPHCDLARLMSQAKAFLFPIRWDEPFGMVVVEAMAAGTPVLAYARGAMAELIKHGETGYLVQSEDEMIAAMQRLDNFGSPSLSQLGARTFLVAKMIEGYETLYKNVARCRRGRESDLQPNRVSSKWNLDRLRNESAYWRSCVLISAGHIGLFAWIGKQRKERDCAGETLRRKSSRLGNYLQRSLRHGLAAQTRQKIRQWRFCVQTSFGNGAPFLAPRI